MSLAQFHPTTPTARANFRHLYYDIGWFGLVSGSTMAFLAVYATRLGASSFQIGLLTAGPAVVNLLFSLPFGRFLENRPIIGTSYRSSILQRMGFVMLAPLPFLENYADQVFGVILITLLMAVPGTLLAIAFNAMFADVVPSEMRGPITSKRNAILAVTMTLSAVISGQILDRVDFPYGYGIIFLFGGVGALLSSYHIGRLRSPKELSVQVNSPVRYLPRISNAGRFFRQQFTIKAQGKTTFKRGLLRSMLGPFMVSYLIFYTFQYVPLPLFPLYNVRVLDLSDGIISLGTALFNVMMMFGSIVLSRWALGSRYKLLLTTGALLYSVYPLILFFARDETLFLIASLFGGLVISILNIGLINRLMERSPDDERPAFMAVHNLVLNLGILVGSLLGPWLADSIDLRTLMLVSGGLRAVAGVLLMRWG
ncbi:MAG: MFS transporter [Chloroflexi bacterium]|nr:MAG: MFS transporter [Chloroflexota bacterium]